MLTLSPILRSAPRKLSGFAAFSRQAFREPTVAGLASFELKALMVRRGWNAMTPQKKSEWAEVGARLRCKQPRARKPNEWAQFVKANHKTAATLPFTQRLKALRKLYNAMRS